MLNLHEQNLQTEIKAFVASLEGANVGKDVTNNITNNVTKDVTKELTERQRILINLIKDNSAITIPEMSRKTAVTERTIKRDIQYLQESGLIRRIGTRKSGYWKIL